MHRWARKKKKRKEVIQKEEEEEGKRHHRDKKSRGQRVCGRRRGEVRRKISRRTKK